MVALLPRLRRFAWGLSGSREEADELVQAACERAISRIHQWQPGSRLDSWMFRIIQTIRTDRLRSERVRRRQQQDGIDPDLHEHVAGPRHLEAHLTLSKVRDAMERLPEEQKTVLLLVCVEGHTYKEASETLGIPMGTVTSRLTRARAALEKILYSDAGVLSPEPV